MMEQSALAEILALELEIRNRLEAERAAAGRWLDERRREIERARAARMSQLQEEAGQRREHRLREAREHASAAVQEARAAAANGVDLTDAQLGPVVRRHLVAILPGQEP